MCWFFSFVLFLRNKKCRVISIRSLYLSLYLKVQFYVMSKVYFLITRLKDSHYNLIDNFLRTYNYKITAR